MTPAIAQRLIGATMQIVHSPAFAQRLSALGLQTLSTPLAAFQKSETAKWGAAVRATGLSIE
jgi:hypothetical protein